MTTTEPCPACGHDDPHTKNGGCGADLEQPGDPPYFVQCMCDGKSGPRIVRFWTDDEPAPPGIELSFTVDQSITVHVGPAVRIMADDTVWVDGVQLDPEEAKRVVEAAREAVGPTLWDLIPREP